MATYHFTVQHSQRHYKCYLHEKGELWVIDNEGKPRVIATSSKIQKVQDARTAVHNMLKALGW